MEVIHVLDRGGIRAEEAHHLAPEAMLSALRLCDPGARDPHRNSGIGRIGTRNRLPDRSLEADLPQRIEERMDLLARQPFGRTGGVERTAAGRHDIPSLAQHDLVAAQSRAVDPDLLQMLSDRIARKEIAGGAKTKTRRVASFQLRLPCRSIAKDVRLEATPGLFDRVLEIRWRTRPLRHMPQRQLVGFNPRALGLPPALNQ
ncbi:MULTISPECIES: hypothetical protein [unclassified Bradyrhizobium]|uniref:hypothetical protein n=1 Tax=unclassified Bradyrhizobium TaxID=2631580 RepID=UPI001CD2D238|nr:MULTISPECIES: hypothetical protein [unclassified Bradyrhizobium]